MTSSIPSKRAFTRSKAPKPSHITTHTQYQQQQQPAAMADYSFLTDSDDEKAVEDLLSEALDHSVLEQVSKINCSSFSSDSPLPSHLESRFRKLKSFPSTTTAAADTTAKNSYRQFKSLKPQSTNSPPIEHPSPIKSVKPESKPKSRSSPEDMSDSASIDDSIFSPAKPNSKSASKSKSRHGSFRYRSNFSPIDDPIFAPSKPDRRSKSASKSKSGNGSSSFRSESNSSTWSPDSASPPRKTGCFWCSPKKSSGKKSKGENRFPGIGLDWGKDDDLLADLSEFSIKEQQRILKKAMIEEEKINREAEKIVKWAKQASARINVSSGLEDDELSDNEITKK